MPEILELLHTQLNQLAIFKQSFKSF